MIPKIMVKTSANVTHKKSHGERILAQARIALNRGWKVIPLLPKSKVPRDKNWTKHQPASSQIESDFDDDSNIGVVLGRFSGGLADVDMDAPEAIVAGNEFLPPTDRMHGRPGKEHSHSFYYSDHDMKPAKFADEDGTMLVELRANGQQTAIPPSIHPTGDRLSWETSGEPASVDAYMLARAVRLVAACALVARHWPAPGQRHEAAMALAGVLLRSGWTEDDARQFVTAAAKASGRDEEWQARGGDVASTNQKLVKGDPVTGAPRLIEILGDGVVYRLSVWLDLSPQSSLLSPTALPMTRAEWPTVSEDAFAGLAGEIVRAIEPNSESDPVALLLQFLTAFGSAVDREPYFQVEADRHYGNLFIVLVGDSSKGRKGTSLAHVLKLFEFPELDWRSNCVKSGMSSGEGLIHAVRDPVLRPLRRGRKQIIPNNDGDLSDLGVGDKRLLAVEPEFAQPLKLMAREGNILSTVIRQAWDTGNLRTLTKNSPSTATGAHISIIAHVTLHELHRYLSETEQANGFGNRFLWACVRRSKSLPEGGAVPEHEMDRLRALVKDALEFAGNAQEMKRSGKARALWYEVYGRLSAGGAGMAGALTGRAEAQVVRLSMLYALLDKSKIIKRRHLVAALALWQYCEDSVRYIFGESSGDSSADKIFQALIQSPNGLTRSEISALFARHLSSKEIARALASLADSGRATFQKDNTVGRPEERWFASRPEVRKKRK